MIKIGVTRLDKRPGRLVLSGRIRRRVFRRAPRSVVLSLDGLTVAETIPAPHEERNVWTFRFTLAADLEAIVTDGAPLSVLADAVELPFAPKVAAARAAIANDPDKIRDVAEKLREGFVVTSKGELREPFARRGAGLAAVLDHYAHCDRVTDEILGRRLHVVGGTLLGAARDGGAIDHDVDFDAAYLSGARDAGALKAEFLFFLRELLRRGERIKLVNHLGHVRRRHFKWRARASRVEIDVFPAFIDAQGCYCRPTFVRIPGGADMILPLRRVPFGGGEVWAPNRMAEKAHAVFGPSWRKPDPFWRKPSFPGFQEAIAGLTLSDDDLLALSDAMPGWQVEELRAALAARGSKGRDDAEMRSD